MTTFLRALLWGGAALGVYVLFLVGVMWLGGQAEKLGNREWNNFK